MSELTSGTKAVHRVEVFTGAGRRRPWPAEAKAAIVEESYASGDPVSVVARQHGLIPQQLFTWRRQARDGIGRRAAAEMPFAEVIVRDAAGAVSTIGIEAAGAVVAGGLDGPLGDASPSPARKGYAYDGLTSPPPDTARDIAGERGSPRD